MAKIGVSIKIDVTKIEKARLFSGQKGTYLDLTTFIDTDVADKYGNHGFITQDCTKEEREGGMKMPILGNCKVFYREQAQAPAQPQAPAQQAAVSMDSFGDDIPF